MPGAAALHLELYTVSDSCALECCSRILCKKEYAIECEPPFDGHWAKAQIPMCLVIAQCVERPNKCKYQMLEQCRWKQKWKFGGREEQQDCGFGKCSVSDPRNFT